MSRRRERRNPENRSAEHYTTARKSDAEARVERITWALLVLVFAIVQLLPEGPPLPIFVPPSAGALFLPGSVLYKYPRHWRVGPVTWVGGAFMALFTYYDL